MQALGIDVYATAIYGVGHSEDEAWAQVVDECSPFFDGSGEVISAEEARNAKFVFSRATQRLLDEVERRGGAIAWSTIDGIACSDEEWFEEEQRKYAEKKAGDCSMHTKGDGSWWEYDGRGIELCRVCPECKE